MSEEYATTRQDFLTATASYLGLDIEAVGADSHVLFNESQGDVMTAVIHVHLKPSDIIGIGKRMQEIAAQNNDIVHVHTHDEYGDKIVTPDQENMRHEYNNLTAAEKGKHGSFGKYVTWRMMNDKPVSSPMQEHAALMCDLMGFNDAPDTRQVTHVDAPEEPEPTNMDAVWLWEHETTQAQRQFAAEGRGERGHEHQYLIQWAMLTDEQKQKAGKP